MRGRWGGGCWRERITFHFNDKMEIVVMMMMLTMSTVRAIIDNRDELCQEKYLPCILLLYWNSCLKSSTALVQDTLTLKKWKLKKQRKVDAQCNIIELGISVMFDQPWTLWNTNALISNSNICFPSSLLSKIIFLRSFKMSSSFINQHFSTKLTYFLFQIFVAVYKLENISF